MVCMTAIQLPIAQRCYHLVICVVHITHLYDKFGKLKVFLLLKQAITEKCGRLYLQLAIMYVLTALTRFKMFLKYNLNEQMNQFLDINDLRLQR